MIEMDSLILINTPPPPTHTHRKKALCLSWKAQVSGECEGHHLADPRLTLPPALPWLTRSPAQRWECGQRLWALVVGKQGQGEPSSHCRWLSCEPTVCSGSGASLCLSHYCEESRPGLSAQKVLPTFTWSFFYLYLSWPSPPHPPDRLLSFFLFLALWRCFWKRFILFLL